MPKLTFEEVLERLSEDLRVKPEEVRSSVLYRKLWVAEWHFPGCLSESQQVCTSKKDAIEAALFFAETEEGAPRGMKTALQRDHQFWGKAYGGTCVTTIFQTTVMERL